MRIEKYSNEYYRQSIYLIYFPTGVGYLSKAVFVKFRYSELSDKIKIIESNSYFRQKAISLEEHKRIVLILKLIKKSEENKN